MQVKWALKLEWACMLHVCFKDISRKWSTVHLQRHVHLQMYTCEYVVIETKAYTDLVYDKTTFIIQYAIDKDFSQVLQIQLLNYRGLYQMKEYDSI